MRWLSLALPLGALVLIAVGAAGAHSQQAIQLQVNEVNTAAYPSLLATVTVVDETGRPITGLPPEAFTAEAEGRPLPVSAVASASDTGLDIAVVLTFDVSGSMAGQPLAAAKEAGKALISQLAPEDQVAIITFSDKVVHSVEFTLDRQAAIAAIDALVASGNTALYQGVADSAATASSSNLPRHAVVLLSDGVDFGGVSQVDATGSLAAASASGAPFFVVGLGSDIDQAYLEQLASVTRGHLFLAPGSDALATLYAGIGSALRQQYVLTVDAASIPEGSETAIRITVSSGGITASTDAAVTIPGVATAIPTERVETPAETGAPAQTAEEEGGGAGIGVGLIVLVIGLAAAAIAATAVMLFRRRTPAPVGVQEVSFRRIQEQPTSHLFPPVAAMEAPTSHAHLSLDGPPSQTYPLGEEPVTIGFTSDCTVRLPEGGTSGWERVRIWRREGRYMLHNLSRMGLVQVSGRPVTWAILEDGDQVQIGRARLVFHERGVSP